MFGDGERVQLLEGEVVVMPAIKAPHAIAMELARDVLTPIIGRGRHVRSQQPLFLDDHSEPEPDAAVVEGRIRDYEAEHPRSALLVVEVYDTTLAMDRGRKRRMYAAAGIPEYWIVNLQRRQLEVYRDPAPAGVPGEPATYRWNTVLGPDDSVEPLLAPGKRVEVADLLPGAMR